MIVETSLLFGDPPVRGAEARLHGSCHCGRTRFALARLPDTLIACSCSYCRKSGAMWAFMEPEAVRMTTAEDTRALYRWGRREVAHHFCDRCGCATHAVSPVFGRGGADFSRTRVGLNARLFDDFDTAALPVLSMDGRNLW